MFVERNLVENQHKKIFLLPFNIGNNDDEEEGCPS